MPLDEELDEEPMPDIADVELPPFIEDIDELVCFMALVLLMPDIDELVCFMAFVLLMPDIDELVCFMAFVLLMPDIDEPLCFIPVLFIPDIDELLLPMPDIEDVSVDRGEETSDIPMLGPMKGNRKSHSPTTKAAPPTAILVLLVVGITSG